jgi:hypothetical protein
VHIIQIVCDNIRIHVLLEINKTKFLIIGSWQVEVELESVRVQLEEESEARLDIERQLVKANGEVSVWRSKYETEANARIEEVTSLLHKNNYVDQFYFPFSAQRSDEITNKPLTQFYRWKNFAASTPLASRNRKSKSRPCLWRSIISRNRNRVCNLK